MYNTKQIEEEVLKFWKDKNIYKKIKEKNKKGKKFYFLQGPPYTSGRLHIAHAWNNSMKDIVLRYKRMRGLNVWDRAGYDMHGLPTANKVQENLKLKDKNEILKYGLKKFVKECIKFSAENAKLMDKDLERLGIWMDYENAYWPIKPEFIEGIWWLIKKAHEQKRLYKGKKIMQWCGNCETSLAKHELEYKNVKENSIYVSFKLKDQKGSLVIWTTTPWTIAFNLAVMVHPDFEYIQAESKSGTYYVAKELAEKFFNEILKEEYKVLETIKGKKMEGWGYIHPFSDIINYASLKKESPNIHSILLSKEYVNLDSGTGLVHCAPGCGPEDYEVGKEYGIKPFNNIDEKGVFYNSGEFNNLIAKKDDLKFVTSLEERRALLGQEKVIHEYAHCWRCHKPVVFRATEQWFLKIEDLIPKLLNFNKKVKWNPKFAKTNYDLWTDNLKDNGLTRQRFWGAPMPIWQCEKCEKIEVIGSSKELKEKAGNVPEDLHRPWIDDIKIKCKCGKQMARIPDVIDVWIDAGTASWNCLYYPKTKKYLDLLPADFILEATEQIRLWFSMLQICSAVAFGKSCYNNVYAHGMILDYQGTKMSKSLGNIISPYEVIDKYSADILRYYMCETPAGKNMNFNWEDIKQKQRNLIVLMNISKYLINLAEEKTKGKIEIEERYILTKKNSVIKKVTGLMESYRIDEIIGEIENLFLELSRIYIRIVREKQSKIVFETIKDVYLDILKMFSIVCPFITEKIWQDLRSKKIVKEESIHLADWPKADEKKIDKKLETEFEIALQIIELGLAERDKEKIGLKWPLAKATINSDKKLSRELQKIIAGQLNIKKIRLNTGSIKVKLDTTMTPGLEAEGYARELARKIQAERKKAGLVKTDLIEVEVISDKLKKMFEKEKKFIKERVNASSISVESSGGKFDYSSKGKIKDKEFEIKFNLRR